MKNIFFFLCIFSVPIHYSAQLILPDGLSYPSDPYKIEHLDNSNQNFYYQLSFVKDKKNPQRKQEAIYILELGNKFSKFTELNTLKTDSLQEKYSHQSTINSKEISGMFDFRAKKGIVLVKDFVAVKNIFQDRVKSLYQYEEKQPVFDWKLGGETKKVLDYICHNATTEYRGRKYIAWYATDIPINNGPYVFQGLPGLILELEDDKKEYHYVATAVDKKSKPIYLRNESEILKVSREQFRKAEKTLHDNPSFFIGDAYNEDGSRIKVKARPYNPIELE
ncbi:Protein of unknown function (Porph_ging) [Elizabethkingia miricola]|nr:Protein of unknown function (Porph_ging) [Elizabethkingia miricola]